MRIRNLVLNVVVILVLAIGVGGIILTFSPPASWAQYSVVSDTRTAPRPLWLTPGELARTQEALNHLIK